MYMIISSTKLSLEVLSCILRCCSLPEISVAQVFSLICALDKNNHLLKIIKLATADSTISRFCSLVYSKMRKRWRKEILVAISNFCSRYRRKKSIIERLPRLCQARYAHERNSNSSCIVNLLRDDIQSNNFVMVKTELLSHRPPYYSSINQIYLCSYVKHIKYFGINISII